MNKYTVLFYGDIKNTKRDPTLMVLMFLPLIIIGAVRYGLPVLSEFLPDIVNYNYVIVAFFCILVSAFPAFVVSFIMLSEKDEKLIPAFLVTPIRSYGYLLSRTLFILLFGFLNSLLLLLLNGLVQFKWDSLFIVSLMSALTAPGIVFFTVAFARNKIEGVTLMKLMNVSLVLPVLSLFLNHSVRWLLGVFPAFWVFQAVDYSFKEKETGWLYLTGLMFLLFFNLFTIRIARRRLLI